MLNQIRTKTGVMTIVCTILIYIYNRTSSINNKNLSYLHNSKYDLSEYSKEINELRHDINSLKKKVSQIEQTLTSSTLFHTIISWLRKLISYFTSISSSFILYSLFLYLFHLCVFNTSTTQTMKLLHIVNIISYSLISIFYTSLQHFHYSNLAWLLLVLLFIKTEYFIMSCPMFMYGLTAGSIIPLSIVYIVRPESLENLLEFVSSSLVIALNWSEDVAQRFNLSHDLFSSTNDINNTILPRKMYSCYTIEYWYNLFSWIIYICFLLSLIIFILNQRFKQSNEFFTNDADVDDDGHGGDNKINLLFSRHISMNETNLASIVLGVIAGFYTTIFLLCFSDVVYLSKEMNKMKGELASIKTSYSNQTIISRLSSITNYNYSQLSFQKKLSGQLCLSYNEQKQILDYINFLCNMAILMFGSYSIYNYGLGTNHGLNYRFIFFLWKILTILTSICLNLHFKQGLPSDIFLYMWIDVNCIGSIYRTIRQTV
ncbi:hypothetical protein I4U23_008419 [Adineta vaga]|nr:hypothetical protein I4U23_008419 [Adineta vaga]